MPMTGDENVIEQITINGVAVPVVNKVATVTTQLTTVYSGSETPSASLGNNGDIYIKVL